MVYARALLGALVTILALDVAWLLLVAGPLFQSMIGPVLRETPLLAPALVFYVVFALGVAHFAVLPGLARGSVWTAIRDGALLGLVAYATFDLTSLAIIKGYTLKLALIDITWGALVAAAAAAAGFLLARRSGSTGTAR